MKAAAKRFAAAISRRASRDGGSAVVEFVLVVPLVLLIFAAICQIAFASYVRSTLIACAAEGARSGAEFDADRGLAVRQTRVALADSIAADAVDDVTATTSRVEGVPFITLATANMQSADNPKGRAWFQLPTGESVRYDGSNGFLWRSVGNADRYLTLDAIVRGEQV